MPFKVLADGSIQCDTAKEAIELSRMMRGGASVSDNDDEMPSENGKSDSKSPSFLKYWNDLEDRGKAVLRVLSAKPDEYIRGEDLARGLGIETNKLPAPMIHVRAIAERHGVGNPVHRKQKLEGTRMRSIYKIDRKLMEALRNELRPT